jgi:hypothetical protein
MTLSGLREPKNIRFGRLIRIFVVSLKTLMHGNRKELPNGGRYRMPSSSSRI